MLFTGAFDPRINWFIPDRLKPVYWHRLPALGNLIQTGCAEGSDSDGAWTGASV